MAEKHFQFPELDATQEANLNAAAVEVLAKRCKMAVPEVLVEGAFYYGNVRYDGFTDPEMGYNAVALLEGELTDEEWDKYIHNLNSYFPSKDGMFQYSCERCLKASPLMRVYALIETLDAARLKEI